MSNLTTIGKIRKLITQGRTNLAAEQLITVTEALDKDLFESALLLKSRIELLEKQVIDGVLSVSDQNIEQARLIRSLLALTTNVEELSPKETVTETATAETETTETVSVTNNIVKNHSKVLWFSVIFIGILAVVFWLSYDKKNKTVANPDKPKVEIVEQKKSFEGYIRFSNGKPVPLSSLDIVYLNTNFKANANESGYFKIELPLVAVGKTIHVTIINKGKAVDSDSILLNEANLKLRTIKVK